MQTPILAQIRELICRKNYEEALRLARELPDDEKEGGEAIALTARLQGQLGNFRAAVQMFDDLETAWPERMMIFKLHAVFLQESGKTEDALEKARQMVEAFPDAYDGYLLSSECLELLGKPAAAMEVIDTALHKWPDNSELLACRRRLEPLCRQRVNTDARLADAREELELSHCQIGRGDEFLSRYLDLFSGREGVHAEQCRYKGNKFGYRPIYDGLDKELIRRHLAGDQTLGIYIVRRDNTARNMVIDLDVNKGFLQAFLSHSDDRRRITALLLETAENICSIAQNVGMELLVESSGYKGLHLWAFSDFPVPARHWRLLGRWLIDELRGMPAEIHAEVFPKQEVVAKDGLGNLVKLPLGIHLASGRRSLFLERGSCKPWPVQDDAVAAVQTITRSEFEEILGRMTVAGVRLKNAAESAERDAAEADEPAAKPQDSLPDTGRAMGLQVKMRLPERFTVEIEQVLAGCRPLCAIVSRAVQEHSLTPECRHVLVYIFSTMGEEGKVFVHQVLNQLTDYDSDRVNAEIKAVPPTTMSCGKVRKYLGELAAQSGCNCQFRLPQGCYASPVAHAGIFPGSGRTLYQPVPVPAALSGRELIAGSSAGLDKLMREYETTGAELARLTERFRLLRRQINRLFDEAGRDEIETRLGTYRRLPGDEADSPLATS